MKDQPKTRSPVMKEMILRGGDGFHGKYKKSKNKASRRKAKQELNAARNSTDI